MYRYTLLSTVFLAAVILTCWLLAQRFKLRFSRRRLLLSLGVLLLLTALFDSLLIQLDMFHYAREYLLGIYIIKAPAEDFLYAIASVILMATLWEAAEARRKQS